MFRPPRRRDGHGRPGRPASTRSPTTSRTPTPSATSARRRSSKTSSTRTSGPGAGPWRGRPGGRAGGGGPRAWWPPHASSSQGSIQQTGNPSTSPSRAPASLAVNRPSGEVAYTRAGSLRLDAQGRIVTTDGLSIEPSITVPPDATAISIGPDGTVSATQPGQHVPTTLGQLTLVSFPNPDGLQAVGHNLFTATGASGEPRAASPAPTAAAPSSRTPSRARTSRSCGDDRAHPRAAPYEINSKVVSAADEMLRNATQMR